MTYLTIDADLQKAAYDMLEQEELAGILLAKMSDVLDYDRSQVYRCCRCNCCQW